MTVENQLNSENEFNTRLLTFINGCEDIVKAWFEKNNYTMPVPTFTFERGQRYIRIVRNDCGRSVHCFIDTTNGDVLKAAGWKAPAKHARGNIFNQDNGLGCMGPYGAAYLRH